MNLLSAFCAGLSMWNPRTCGEKLFLYRLGCKTGGSPPHGRGKENQQQRRPKAMRITPAQAGKRGSGLLFHRVWWDHPRVGGEKPGTPWRWLMVTGSPPRGRGKAAERPGRFFRQGITPAWAGKRYSSRCGEFCTGDHPRVGGEKFSTVVVGFLLPGSPPRGRGKVGAALLHPLAVGITPAWSGKRAQHAARDLPFQDHPRVGGEKGFALLNDPRSIGSPPRRRGKEV